MAEESGTAQVRIKFVLDEESLALVERMRAGMGGVGEHTKKAREHAGGLAGEVFKGEAALELVKVGAEKVAEALERAVEFGKEMVAESVEAADAMNMQLRSMGGLMFMLDGGAHSMGQIRDYAGGVREDLAKVATAAGLSTKEIVGMYTAIVERGGVSTEQAKKLTEEMATVGKVVPGGTSGLAEGFSNMELGIIRARNPLVQLIASTGTLRGNAHAVAAALQHMAPEKQLELARAAIEKQADLMKKGGAITPTFGELRTSLGNIREMFMEAVGNKLMERLIPALERVRDWLMANSEKITAFGERMGTLLGNVVDMGSEIFEGMQRDWTVIGDIMESAATDWKAIWEGITGDANDTGSVLKDAAGDLAAAFKLGSEAARWVLKEAAILLDVATAPAQLLQSLTPFGAKGMETASFYSNRVIAGGERADAAAETEKMRAEYRDRWAQDINRGDLPKIGAELREQLMGPNSGTKVLLDAMAKNAEVVEAFAQGAIDVGGKSLNEIASISPAMQTALSKQVSDVKSAVGKGFGMYGGQTFHIKQDFRDGDPDRVLTVFRRDLVRSALSRQQSRLSQPGGF